MKRNRGMGIRRSLWLAIALTVASTVLGASALHGYYLYVGARQRLLLRVQTIAETYANQLVAKAALGQRDELRAFVDEVKWPQDSCLLALLSATGEPFIVRGNDQLFRAVWEENDLKELPGAVAWRRNAGDDETFPGFLLAAAPIEAENSAERFGTVLYAVRRHPQAGLSHQEIWSFFAKLILIAAAGVVIGFWWLNLQVLTPLSLLSRSHQEAKRRSKAGLLPTNRSDEIGELARVLASLHLDLDEWQQRVTQLERSVNDRVAAETQRITRELKQAEKKVWTDPLTKLGNRRLLDEKFAAIFQAQQAAGNELSIAMVDLDNFKNLNDNKGHHAGDELLKFTGELLRQCLREQDLAIRLGGDEFVLVLPSVSVVEAETIAKRTIAMFSQRAKLFDLDPQPSMSVGIASLSRHHPETPEGMLDMADNALYAAKQAGKAQVMLYQPNAAVVTADPTEAALLSK